jgi:signal transduction histidine kinase
MKKGIFALHLTAGALIVALSIYGYTLLRQRPGLPQEIELASVVEIDGIKILKATDIDFALLYKTPEDSVRISVRRDGRQESLEVDLIPYYFRNFIPTSYLLIGLLCMAIGALVFILRSSSRKARVYYWLSLTFSYSVIINSGFYLAKKGWFSHLPAALFFIFYPLATALLLHFAFQHTPGRWRIRRIYGFLLVYSPSLVFMGLMVTLYILVIVTGSIETYRLYMMALDALRIYLMLYVSLAVGHLIHLFKRIFLEEQRAQIKWALYGLVVGLSPLLFLYMLPHVLGLNPLISEELSNVFFLVIPVAFFFSIIKYKLLKIELVINRSLVYGLLSIFTVSIYLFLGQVLQNFAARWVSVNYMVISGVAAFVAASLFHPARKKIQEFVDKSFYRLSYDYKKSILSFMEQAQKMLKPDHLTDLFLQKIDRTLPLERTGVSVLSKKTTTPRILYRKNWEDSLDGVLEKKLSGDSIYFKKSAIRTEEGIDFSQEQLLDENDIEAILPLHFQTTNLTGALILGRKKSAERYSREDIELLQTLSRQYTLNLERIQLQEEVFLEKAEKEKLNELNRLKTEFISSVSHEIRTPMSSIQGLTEILTGGRVKDSSKRKELLELIGSECARLSRFLHNILDFGKIETQTKRYSLKDTDICALVEEILQLFEPRLEADGFALQTHFPSRPVFLKIDGDAIKQALTNLIDNAIKYSKAAKEVEILVKNREEEVEIAIKDKGIGISEKEQQKIFKNFYRSAEAVKQFPDGVGLGLKIIKHIMDAHGGSIKITSQPGKGSTFSLIFKKP